MTTRSGLNSLALFLVLLGGSPDSATAQPVQRPATEADVRKNGWLRDYREAVRLAKATGRPIMVLARCVP